MRLLFMRHADAVDRENWKQDDFSRPLSARGERDTAKAAERLAAIGLRVELILSSPLARALRTAELVAAAIRPARGPLTDDRLAPGFDEDALDDILEEQGKLESILFVGHEPDFGLVVGSLVGAAHLEFKKGALALADWKPDTGEARLLWLVPQTILI